MQLVPSSKATLSLTLTFSYVELYYKIKMASFYTIS